MRMIGSPILSYRHQVRSTIQRCICLTQLLYNFIDLVVLSTIFRLLSHFSMLSFSKATPAAAGATSTELLTDYGTELL
jgi:hypothetical protein